MFKVADKEQLVGEKLMGAQQEKEDGVNVDGRLSRRFESWGRSREKREKRKGKDDLNYTMVGFRH